jgi:TPR repeat protein
MSNLLKLFTSAIRRVSGDIAAAHEDDVLNDLLPPKEPWTIEVAREYIRDLCAKANAGDSEAEFALASEYMSDGQFLRPDPIKEAKWMKRSAEHGHAVAQLLLASMYSNGMGVPKDDVAAAKWCLASAQQGSSNAGY